jgi:hypothetical protein
LPYLGSVEAGRIAENLDNWARAKFELLGPNKVWQRPW